MTETKEGTSQNPNGPDTANAESWTEIGGVQVPVFADQETSRQWVIYNAELWAHLSDQEIDDLIKRLKSVLKFSKTYVGYFHEAIKVFSNGIVHAIQDIPAPVGNTNGSKPHAKTKHALQHDLLLAEALRLAALGVYVVPLHEPLFDQAGNCIGCTCESFKRSEEYRQLLEREGKGRRFNPNYTCKNQGKHPRVGLDWEEKASIDSNQIKKWWRRWPTANLGIAAGKSGQILLDQDKYKDTYQNTATNLTQDECQTPTVISGRGGENLVYELPAGATYGNATGDLPAGVDIRGCGGMYVAYPSIHWCGKPYQWEIGYALGDIPLLPLPQKIEDLLKTANGNGRANGPFSSEAVERSSILVEKILKEKEIDHKGREDYGKGKRWVLKTCVFNPDADPHEDDDDAPFIIVHPDGKIAAGCQHNRCRHRIATEGKFEIDQDGEKVVITSGWRLLKKLLGIHPRPAIEPVFTDDGRAVDPISGEIFGNPIDPGNDIPSLDGYNDGYANSNDESAISYTSGNDIISRIEQIIENQEMDDAEKRSLVRKLIKTSGHLERDDLDYIRDTIVTAKLFNKGDTKDLIKRAVSDHNEKKKAVEKAENERKKKEALIAAGEEHPPPWPYAIEDDRIIFQFFVPGADGPKITSKPVADFYAHITDEYQDEQGNKGYVIKGHAKRGHEFTFEISAENFADTGKLCAALETFAGAKDPIYAKMGMHLGPAIKLLTLGDVIHTKHFARTGWYDKKFLIMGREPDGVKINLPGSLPYRIDTEADLEKGLDAFRNSIMSMTPAQGVPIWTAFFQAPMADVAGWRDERYGVFVKGGSNKFKTSNMMVCMGLYGRDFTKKSNLIKFGEGVTQNAVMALGTHASDMPILIDNYKPSTCPPYIFIGMIHNFMEGGEKKRLERVAKLRESNPINAWLFCTGEDIPAHDAATIARLLVIDADWSEGKHYLTKAQENQIHLPAVGNVWLDWIESEEGRSIIKTRAASLVDERDKYFNILMDTNPTMTTAPRIAANLATNAITYSIVCFHPIIGPIFAEYEKAYLDGLVALAHDMTASAIEANEAQRYLNLLNDLLFSGQAILVRDEQHETILMRDRKEHLIVGWIAPGGGAYLIPKIARAKVDALAKDRLGDISDKTLNTQLDKLHMIGKHDKEGLLLTKRLGYKVAKVLHLLPESFTFTPEDNSDQ